MRSEHPVLRATIVSDNAETLDGLGSYLRRAGVVTKASRSLRAIADAAHEEAAVVLFPDDYDAQAIDAIVELLLARRRRTVLVTREPKRFRTAKHALVIPKPAWGWTILDAIRAQLDPAVRA